MPTSEPAVLWAVIDPLPAAARNERDMTKPLLAALSRLPIPRLARFQGELLECMDALLTWRLWEAADVVHGDPLSGDTFADFRLWVVAQGSHVCREVQRDPDCLADLAEVQRLVRLPQPWADADHPQFASLGMLADQAFELILAKLGPAVAGTVDRPAALDEQIPDHPRDYAPADHGVDAAVRRRLPRLSALRGRLR